MRLNSHKSKATLKTMASLKSIKSSLVQLSITQSKMLKQSSEKLMKNLSLIFYDDVTRKKQKQFICDTYDMPQDQNLIHHQSNIHISDKTLSVCQNRKSLFKISAYKNPVSKKQIQSFKIKRQRNKSQENIISSDLGKFSKNFQKDCHNKKGNAVKISTNKKRISDLLENQLDGFKQYIKQMKKRQKQTHH